MRRIFVTMFRGALCAGAIASFCLTTPAQAQVEVRIFPPAWFIATAPPVYYEGHAAYWYGNRWYYRDGGSWRSYNNEPDHLREYRGHHEVGRQYYGRAHGGGFHHR